MKEFIYKGYGCPDTEMWSRRHEFEQAHPHLDLSMNMDAPHYASVETRKTYFAWEATL